MDSKTDIKERKYRLMNIIYRSIIRNIRMNSKRKSIIGNGTFLKVIWIKIRYFSKISNFRIGRYVLNWTYFELGIYFRISMNVLNGLLSHIYGKHKKIQK